MMGIQTVIHNFWPIPDLKLKFKTWLIFPPITALFGFPAKKAPPLQKN
jgi:hypothetical protein